MRTMLIMRGAPGTGKTTLIGAAGLSRYALGFDMFRHLFGITVPVQNIETGENARSLRIRPDVEKAVVEAAHAALEARLESGSTVVWDATSVVPKQLSFLLRRAYAHGYTPVVVDVQGDVSLKELEARNARRGTDAVDLTVLRKMWQAGHYQELPSDVTVVPGTVDAVRAVVSERSKTPVVTSARTIVVGDVHSCAAPLCRAIADLDTPQTQWVFAGDLFDRGPDAVGVWNAVHALLAAGRATVVTGNHELNLRHVNNHTSPAPFLDSRATRDALLSHGIKAARQSAFVNATVPAVLIDDTTGGVPWLVTHGGVSDETAHMIRSNRMVDVSDAECVYGLGDREHTYHARTAYDVGAFRLAGRQLHGHRNGSITGETVAAIRETPDGPVVCLEAGASTGGHVRLAVITPGCVTPEIHEYADEVDPERSARFAQPPWQRQAVPSLLERMRDSEHVTVRPVKGFRGVVAANFTREAFRHGAWDDVSMHARGLFLDATTGDVLARGYEKFFHIGEAPGRTLDQWLDPDVTAYPVRAVKKFNGYLAIVGSIGGRLAVFSKAGTTPYADAARTMLEDALGGGGCEQLRGMLERTRVTAVFEVLRADDPHPVAEPGEDRLVLLDAIRNQEVFATDDRMAANIARRFGFEYARDHTLGEAATPDDTPALIEAAETFPLEGAVLIDARGYRSKVKSHGYTVRKSARSALERFWRGNTDTLGPTHRDLEDRLYRAGVLSDIRAGKFDMAGLDGAPRFDLAAVFDALDRATADA